MSALSLESLTSWLSELEAQLGEDDCPELRRVVIRGHQTSSRLAGAVTLWEWAPESEELPPLALLAQAAWAELEGHDAPSWRTVQGRASCTGGVELRSKTWSGPGLAQEPQEQTATPSAPASSQQTAPASAYPQDIAAQLLRVQVEQAGETRQLLRQLSEILVAQLRGMAGVLPSLTGLVERQSAALVRATTAQARAEADQLRTEAAADAALAEAEAQAGEQDLVETVTSALAGAVVDRVIGAGAVKLGLAQAAQLPDEQLSELLQTPAAQALLPRLLSLSQAR